MLKVNTVIGINSDLYRVSGNKKKNQMDYRKELEEIITMIDQAKLRLGNVSCDMDAEELDTTAIDEAMDALDDAVDILEDAVDTVEETL